MNEHDALFEQFGKFYKKDTNIFNEGDFGEQVYIIQTGKVRVYKIIGEQEKTLGILGPGDFLGEMSVLEKKPRSASAMAIQDTRLLVLDMSTFEELIKSNGEIALRIIKKLVQRLRIADSLIESITFPDPLQRIVSLLVSLAKDSSGKSEMGSDIGMTLKEIAQLCGLSISATEEVLDKLMELKLISFQDKSISVLDYQGLLNYKEILGIKNS